MISTLIALSYWLHALATVVFIGHFVLLAAIYLPALAENPATLSGMSKRSRWWIVCLPALILLLYAWFGNEVMENIGG